MSSLKKRPMVVLVETVLAAAVLSACGGGGETPAGAQTAIDGAATAIQPETQSETQPEASGIAAEAAGEDVAAADAGNVDSSGVVAEDPDAIDEPTPAESTLAAADAIGHETPPVVDAEGEEAAIEREDAQSLSIDSGDSGYAKPKVAALDYENNYTTGRRDLLAKFKFVILGARNGSSLDSFARGIKSKSSSTKVASYTAFNELSCSASSSSYNYSLVQMANSADFWLRYASGSKAQWTTSYGACDMNVSKWGKKNSSGRTWMQEKANFDYNRAFKYSSIDYVFSDNTFFRPRVDADWKRIKTNQSRTLSDIQSSMRGGHAAYWSAIKAKRSSLKIIGNSDRDLSHAEYVDKLQGAFFEGAMGRSYSIETYAGWSPMMDRYRALIRNTSAPNDVFFQVYGSSSNYRLMRYGLASALMHNGWYVYLPSSGTLRPSWYDDYEAPLGRAVDSPPTAPKSNGIWMRKYENGIVLVNPKSSSATINVGTGYKRLKGTQDPGVNNGQAQSSVTLPAKSGLIMIRR